MIYKIIILFRFFDLSNFSWSLIILFSLHLDFCHFIQLHLHTLCRRYPLYLYIPITQRRTRFQTPVQFDTRSGNIVQEYDRHLGAVNTITFIDQDRRFVSTSDDKSLRCWEWLVHLVVGRCMCALSCVQA